MRRVVTLTLLAAGFALSGCANLTTSTKRLDLRSRSVAMDVKQRVVTSSWQETETFDANGNVTKRLSAPVICAEPSPDALTVLGASVGVSANHGDQDAVKLSTALAESGASIGLRTQSIQLLRDAMYRLCEGYAAGAISPEDFAAMQRRYQSTMLGVLAIEQLTGPIVATQAVLTASAEARSGAGEGDVAVSAARVRYEKASEKVIEVESKVGEANKLVEKLRDERDELQKELLKEQVKEKRNEETIATVGEQIKSKEDALADAQDARSEERKRLKLAQVVAQHAEKDLNSARSAVAAAARAGGELGAVAQWNATSSDHLSRAVHDIVVAVNTSFERDACLKVVTKDPSPMAPGPLLEQATFAFNAAFHFCGEILLREATKVAAPAAAPPAVAPPAAAPPAVAPPAAAPPAVAPPAPRAAPPPRAPPPLRPLPPARTPR